MTRGRAALLVLLIASALLVSTFGFFFYRDNFSTHYPVKTVSADVFRSFGIPYWNFFDGGGQPLAGNPNTLTFYPDNVLYLFLPSHIAFNLHFVLHLALAYFAMRALTRSAFGGALYAMSGLAVSATAFYNLIAAVALVPLALLAVERRRPLLLGVSFGLLALAGEPVTILAAAIAVAIVAFRRMPVRELLLAAGLSAVVAAPQLIAYSEIAGEVERAAGMSARTVLNASLHPVRIAEIAAGPLVGFLNDAGDGPYRARLFSTIFLGLIVVPALWRRGRYALVVAVMLFFALGRYNPLVVAFVENVPAIRIVRFPEKFVLPAIVALAVLSADYFRSSSRKNVWLAVTFLPLAFVLFRALPLDLYAPYAVDPVHPRRIRGESIVPAGVMPARQEYRLRALALEPIFGAVAGVRYAITPSPDGMHSLRSRMVVERYAQAPPDVRAKYLRIAGCDVPRALPAAYFPRQLVGGRDIYQETGIVESPRLDESVAAVIGGEPFTPAAARVVKYNEHGQTIDIDVVANGRALLVVNQTYFKAWDAGPFDTVPVNIDRLGVLVPAGRHSVTLRFGRHRLAVAAAWAVSLLALLLPLVEKLHRRSGEVERPGDEDRLEPRP